MFVILILADISVVENFRSLVVLLSLANEINVLKIGDREGQGDELLVQNRRTFPRGLNERTPINNEGLQT